MYRQFWNLRNRWSAREKQIVVGYRDAQTFLKEEFEQQTENLYISTEDGSVGTKGNVMDAIRENESGSRYDLCLRTDTNASCDQSICRKTESNATFPWKREWHVESEPVLHVYVNRKKKMHTAM